MEKIPIHPILGIFSVQMQALHNYVANLMCSLLQLQLQFELDMTKLYQTNL
jgi:hypothetical protein